jgi:hypothetical protein
MPSRPTVRLNNTQRNLLAMKGNTMVCIGRRGVVNPKALLVRIWPNSIAACIAMKIDGTAASRNVATIRNFAQMVIGSLLALFLRCPKTFSLRAKLISSASMVGAWGNEANDSRLEDASSRNFQLPVVSKYRHHSIFRHHFFAADR